MASKKHRNPVSEAASPEQSGGPPWVLIGGILAVAAVAVFMLYPGSGSETPATPAILPAWTRMAIFTSSTARKIWC